MPSNKTRERVAYWTADRIEQLRDLLAQGLSYSQIAREMGGITRNAALGKATRLGFAGQRRLPGPRQDPRPRLRPQHTSPIAARREPEPLRAPLVLEDGAHVTLLTLTGRMCAWPYGDPDKPDFHYCGHGRRDALGGGGPYCAAHAGHAYQGKVKDAPRYGTTMLQQKTMPWAN